ncbi:unnamed protein product [Soboliphyme baturini]|uniref:Secreted protein n=1 Tax=Soboliphyme baturini TaxID=241478 RepID=A0A183ISJ2_9BILA|nr:unnamed protein product [Soboliphyme baturini]
MTAGGFVPGCVLAVARRSAEAPLKPRPFSSSFLDMTVCKTALPSSAGHQDPLQCTTTATGVRSSQLRFVHATRTPPFEEGDTASDPMLMDKIAGIALHHTGTERPIRCRVGFDHGLFLSSKTTS